MEILGNSAVFKVGDRPVTRAKVGDRITFDIPGHDRVHLFQLQDGRLQADISEFHLPMPEYELRPEDVGYFQGRAFKSTPPVAFIPQPSVLDREHEDQICSWSFEVVEA